MLSAVVGVRTPMTLTALESIYIGYITTTTS